MPTDLDAKRTCELTDIRIAGLTRLRANDWPQDVAVFPVALGQNLHVVIAARDRFPIKNLRVTAKLPFSQELLAHPIGMVHFPEAATHIPDPVLQDETVDVSANTTQSFLLQVPIPVDADPGGHIATVRLTSDSHRSVERSFKIEVFPLRPIQGHDLGHCIFWTHWKTLSRYYGIELWSERLWKLTDCYLAEMAAGGMNGIMTSINDDPLRYPLPEPFYHYNHYPGMIRWIRKIDGSFRFDYTVYDRYVKLNMKHGIDREIECHALLPCKMQKPWISYHDEAAGKNVAFETTYDSPEYITAWEALIKDFAEHNRQVGWLNKVCICPYDEPQHPESFTAVARMVKSIAPEIRITAAISVDKAIAVKDFIDIATIHPDYNYTPDRQRELSAQGIEVRWYNCCEPPWGNTLFCCPLADSYRMPWMTAANDFAGYLRWSIVNWTENPWHDPAFNWPTGDMYLLYPGKGGPATSLRWEAYKAGRADLALLLDNMDRLSAEKSKEIDAHIKLLGTLGPIEAPYDITGWRTKLFSLIKSYNKLRSGE